MCKCNKWFRNSVASPPSSWNIVGTWCLAQGGLLMAIRKLLRWFHSSVSSQRREGREIRKQSLYRLRFGLVPRPFDFLNKERERRVKRAASMTCEASQSYQNQLAGKLATHYMDKDKLLSQSSPLFPSFHLMVRLHMRIHGRIRTGDERNLEPSDEICSSLAENL